MKYGKKNIGLVVALAFTLGAATIALAMSNSDADDGIETQADQASATRPNTGTSDSESDAVAKLELNEDGMVTVEFNPIDFIVKQIEKHILGK